MKTTLGGERLGSGSKNELSFRNYERSTHNLNSTWKSTMSAGTLVPFMSLPTLPGDTIEIDLDVDVMTHPTIGPLFGRYKVQLDVFEAPIALYQAEMRLNLTGVGLDMESVKLPQWGFQGTQNEAFVFEQQISPSSIAAYLGVRGVGSGTVGDWVYREFNAVPYLMYVDIYKCYYANKQESGFFGARGAVIHNRLVPNEYTLSTPAEEGKWKTAGNYNHTIKYAVNGVYDESANVELGIDPNSKLVINFLTLSYIEPERILVTYEGKWTKATDIFLNYTIDYGNNQVIFYDYAGVLSLSTKIGQWYINDTIDLTTEAQPKVRYFNLQNIDLMAKQIMRWDGEDGPFVLNGQMQDIEPYSLIFHAISADDKAFFSIQSGQEGLLIKTYQSDLFNNWVDSEWLDGDNGVNTLSMVQVVDGEFSMDQLNFKKKLFDVLMRTAVSGGTIQDWVKATWDVEFKGITSPMYVGGASRELVFQEVVSNASTPEQPLGTLAGKGRVAGDQKGGKLIVRTDQPSYILGIVSITPRINYSQGNRWDTNLKNMDEFHKPGLDGIGFQDLITDQMHWADTHFDENGNVIFQSAGKQPAWINYQTDVDECLGNFALEADQMWMTLNRRYEIEFNTQGGYEGIKDLTTYIDPSKFNNIFAYTRLDAQNFWVQIDKKITARRKMSARQIPNI